MTQLSIYGILDKKKRGGELSASEIQFFIDGMMNENIGDYQTAALLMAIYINGMTTAETADLTDAMLYSGKVMNFDDQTVVDKHSTGGIGDKTSFILAPIAAACGVKVPMIAGRGLGFTGGTVDKIEAIPGFKTDLGLAEFEKRLMENGIVLIGQTDEIAPADKKIYSLRDVTATIESIPLITASIMSKKLAEGANGIVMDIKVGSGAFMADKDQASELAKSIIGTAKRFNKKAVCMITNMDQPLGNAVGNSLEIIESIDVLKGQGPEDITIVSLHLAAHMIHVAGKANSFEEALEKAKASITDGSALKEFRDLIKAQGGDEKVVDDYSLLDVAPAQMDVISLSEGYVESFINKDIGFACTDLGGGRKVITDELDYGVGFILKKKVGDKVSKGDTLLTIYHRENQQELAEQICKNLQENIISISSQEVKPIEVLEDLITE